MLMTTFRNMWCQTTLSNPSSVYGSVSWITTYILHPLHTTLCHLLPLFLFLYLSLSLPPLSIAFSFFISLTLPPSLSIRPSLSLPLSLHLTPPPFHSATAVSCPSVKGPPQDDFTHVVMHP